MTPVGEICFCVFLLSMGALVVQRNQGWVYPLLISFLIGYLSDNRASRRFRRQAEEIRAKNSLNHPGIFEGPPPTDLDAVPGDRVDLYDADTCTFLGTVAKSDIRGFVEEWAEGTGESPNDVYVLVESLEMFPDPKPSEEFVSLLKEAFATRDDLVLRWMPPAEEKLS
ncbi:MAG: hypothetical protein KC964_16680 [Candidatus Omnitrophica bacterium]|nr:hypothetical protein [Candidatus Omnitrophota bacterium]